MNLSLPRVVAVFLLAIALGAAFTFAYPSVDIDATLATVIVLVALAVESLGAFICRRVANRG
jgi:uncharacterized membrane protein YphA (DoxX/SURF4 family)